MAGKIVVIGSSNVDLIMKMERLPRLGESVPNAEFSQTFGGKGANAAVGAARAGGEVYFVGCVGDDGYGRQVIDNLARLGVQVEYVQQASGVASGTAFIMVDAQGRNYLSIAPGANYRLSPQRVEQVEGLVGTAEMVLFQFEILPETLKYAIDLARRKGKRILFNLAPAQPIEDAYLGMVDILVVNEVEAEFLCGLRVDSREAVRQAARALLAKGPSLVILTLGEQGAYAASGEQEWQVPAFQVTPVDTTAAGDIFCGALAVALVEGKSIRESLRFANAAAAISVTRLGAQPSAPSRAEIEEFLAQHPA